MAGAQCTGRPIDFSYSVEARQRLGAGLFVAGRFGSVLFNRIDLSGRDYHGETGAGYLEKWDHDAHRLQLGGGYRPRRNVEVRAEYAWNRTEQPDAPHADLFSLQAFWEY